MLNNKGSHTPWDSWDCVRVGRGNARPHLPRCPRGSRPALGCPWPLLPSQANPETSSLRMLRVPCLGIASSSCFSSSSFPRPNYHCPSRPSKLQLPLCRGRAFHSGSLQSGLDFPRDSHLVLEGSPYSRAEIKSFVSYFFKKINLSSLYSKPALCRYGARCGISE